MHKVQYPYFALTAANTFLYNCVWDSSTDGSLNAALGRKPFSCYKRAVGYTESGLGCWSSFLHLKFRITISDRLDPALGLKRVSLTPIDPAALNLDLPLEIPTHDWFVYGNVRPSERRYIPKRQPP